MPNQRQGRLKSPHNDVRSDGATRVMELVRAINRSYEGSLTVGTTPVTIDFNADQGWNAIQGWIINDGPANLQWQFSRDGVTYGDLTTMLPSEMVNLKGFDVHSLRLVRVAADADYRVFLI